MTGNVSLATPPLFIEILPSGTTNLRESELDAPHLTLVAQAIFADNLQLGVAAIEVRITIDVSRDKLMLSGRDVRTDELTRMDDEGPYRSSSRIEAP